MLVIENGTDAARVSVMLDAKDRCNPFDDDGPGDARVAVSRRGLVRLAVAAAGVGARFEREGLGADPAAWLLAPRRVFDGECAVDACVDVAPMRRCLALHAPGAQFGLDADPEVLDEACGEEPETASAGVPPGGRRPGRTQRMRDVFAGSLGEGSVGAGPRLWSCSMTRMEPGARVRTFVAGVAQDEREFRRRLFDRFGAMAALSPAVRAGFDQYDPIAASLVSEQLADWLAVVASQPGRCGEQDFEVVVEHRIRA